MGTRTQRAFNDMPEVKDLSRIRTILETDRSWSAYALGDLEPDLFPKTSWFCPSACDRAIILLYRGFSTPVLFALGSKQKLAELVAEIMHSEPKLYLSVQTAGYQCVQEHYEITEESSMFRMVLDVGAFKPGCSSKTVRLNSSNLQELLELYSDGESRGEAPDFFSPTMLEHGAFYGVFENDVLVAAAGTHLIAPLESVAAIGNVYTHSTHRGKGLAVETTAAVVAELLHAGIRTIALNVKQSNKSAISAYTHLGFRSWCEFYEGLAIRPASALYPEH